MRKLKKKRRQNRMFIADFETTGIDLYKDESYVTLWELKNHRTKERFYGFDIKSFLNFKWENNDCVYFHNLNFDVEFIVYSLISNHIPYDDDLKLKNCFMYLKTILNNHFFIRIKIGKIKIVIKDSYKIIPLSISKIGEELNYPKGEIDYRIFNDLYLCHNKKAFLKDNPDIIKYLDRDIDIVDYFFEEISRNKNLRCKSVLGVSTISALALNEFLPYPVFKKYYINRLTKDDWIYLKCCYMGGITMVNPLLKNKVINQKIYYYDVNSLYPYIMKNCKLPYGSAQNKHLKNGMKFLLFRVFKFKLKHKDTIPHIGIKSGLIKNSKRAHLGSYVYLREYENENGLDIGWTQKEYDLIRKNYYFKAKFIRSYYFKQKIIFEEYINTWSKVKQNAQKGTAIYLFSKLLQNSLYGKFGQHPFRLRKFLDENYEEQVHSEWSKDIYPLHTAAAITSYARLFLINMIKKYEKHFIYCDTDSLILNCKIDDKFVNHNIMGKWDLERTGIKFKAIKSKCYLMKLEKGGYFSAVSGLPKKAQNKLNFDNFKVGAVFKECKLGLKRVKGGKLLYPVDFKINE